LFQVPSTDNIEINVGTRTVTAVLVGDRRGEQGKREEERGKIQTGRQEKG